MNREIKFRAYNEFTKKMFNVDVLAISECTWDCPDYGKTGMSIPYMQHCKLMQYTGLKDKDGNKIYEGDILKLKCYSKFDSLFAEERIHVSKTSLVEYWQSLSKIGYRLRDCKGKTMMINQNCLNTMEAEIIGNIYENPELLTNE